MFIPSNADLTQLKYLGVWNDGLLLKMEKNFGSNSPYGCGGQG